MYPSHGLQIVICLRYHQNLSFKKNAEFGLIDSSKHWAHGSKTQVHLEARGKPGEGTKTFFFDKLCHLVTFHFFRKPNL